jgi:hypothetical protein
MKISAARSFSPCICLHWYPDPITKAGKQSFSTAAVPDANDLVGLSIDELGNESKTTSDRQNRAVKSIDDRGNISAWCWRNRSSRSMRSMGLAMSMRFA